MHTHASYSSCFLSNSGLWIRWLGAGLSSSAAYRAHSEMSVMVAAIVLRRKKALFGSQKGANINNIIWKHHQDTINPYHSCMDADRGGGMEALVSRARESKWHAAQKAPGFPVHFPQLALLAKEPGIFWEAGDSYIFTFGLGTNNMKNVLQMFLVFWEIKNGMNGDML